jgi:hypothetical protein
MPAATVKPKRSPLSLIALVEVEHDTPIVTPTNVMKAVLPDNTPAFLTKAFTAQTDFWLTFDIGFEASPTMFDAVFAAPYDAGPNEMFYIGSPAGANFELTLAEGWMHIEVQVTSGTSAECFVNGISIGTMNPVNGSHAGATTLKLGFLRVIGSNFGPTYIAYYKNVKVGTTRGGGDVFADDLSGEDFSAWDSHAGGVSKVLDPFV